ncbi:MAG: hypothetical protein HOA21_00230, partial [Rhodospirillaceae bacterium]|nr:hypothetical protein [Rhodospirillaceae bacterium]
GIFRPRGSKQHFTIALSDYTAATATARNAAHSAKDWKALMTALAEVSTEKQQLNIEMRALAAETAQLERVRRAKPQFLKLDQIQSELTGFGDLPPLPDDFEAQVRTAGEALSAAQGGARGSQDNLLRLKTARDAIVVDTAILAQGERKETLITLQDRASTANLDIPRRSAELQEFIGVAKAEMARIGLTGEPVGFDHSKLPSNPDITRARAMIAEHRNIRTRLEAAQASRDDAQTAMGRIDDRIGRMAPLTDVSTLRRLIAQQEQNRGLEATVVDRQRSLADLEDRLMRHAPSLALALDRADAEDLANRVFPTSEQISAAREERAAYLRRRDDQERLMRELAAELSVAQGALARLEADSDLPSPNDLADARRARDETWQRIKGKIETGQMPAAEMLGDLDARLSQADAIVDKMAGAAARYEEISSQNRRIDRDKDRLANHGRQHDEILKLVDGWQQGWQDLWLASGITAPEVEAAQRILDHRESALDLMAEIGREQRALSDMENAIAQGRQQILSELGCEQRREMTLLELLHEASEILSAAGERQNDLKNLTAQKEDCAATLKEAEVAVADWQTREVAAMAEWDQDQGRNLAIENAEAVFDLMENLRAKLGEIDGLQHRIKAMEHDITAFNALATELAETFGLKDMRGTPMEITAAIAAKFDGAMADHTKADLMDREIAQAESASHDAVRAVQNCAEAIEALCQTAHVERFDQIAAVIAKCTAANALKNSAAAINETLANDSDGIDMQALRQQCDDTDPDQIPGRLGEIEQVRPGLDARLEEIIRRERDLQHQSDEIRQAQGAADPEQAAAQKLVVVVEEAERYLRLKTSARLLRWAIEQHRKEMQGPLLTRASALFQTLTVGRYKRLFPDFDDADHARLMGENSNGDSLLITQMSDGTRDQLYLALRLAAVEHYGENASATLLPFVADDLLINFDDARTAAGFQALAELSKSVQVIVFTHHQHLGHLAQAAVGEDGLTIHHLN